MLTKAKDECGKGQDENPDDKTQDEDANKSTDEEEEKTVKS